VNQQVKDVAQLVTRIRIIEKIKYEKRRKRFDKIRREKIAYLLIRRRMR